MDFLFENIDYSQMSVANYLTELFQVSEQEIIEYCKKLNFNYREVNIEHVSNRIILMIILICVSTLDKIY